MPVDKTDSQIPIKSHDSPLSRELLAGGVILKSQTTRTTEVDAEDLIENGHPKTATNTTAEMESKGLFRCSHDGQFHPRECFSPDPRTRTGLQSVCNQHRALHDKQRKLQMELQAQQRYKYRKRREK